MSTSGTYAFASPQSKDLIEDAYERIGILPDILTSQQITSAQRSLNFILQEWINKGNNLWTVQTGMLGLNPGQSTYYLPPHAIDIKTAAIRTSVRNIGGTAASSAGGVAQNAFDGNPQTACIQDAPDGNISYTWGQAPYAIAMVGIQSNETLDYTLVFEISYTGLDGSWAAVGAPPQQTYTVASTQWFAITAPTLGTWFRVKETGGLTLTIQEIYLNTSISDTLMTRISEQQYTSTANKNVTGKPSSFYVNRQINPTVTLYPVQTAIYNNMYFTYWKAIEDVGAMVNNSQIPTRFLEALTSALAFKLGMKKADMDLNKLQLLGAIADKAYLEAGSQDRERVPLRIYGAFGGWTSQ